MNWKRSLARVVAVAVIVTGVLAIGLATTQTQQWQRSADTELQTNSDVSVFFSSDAAQNFSETTPFGGPSNLTLKNTTISGSDANLTVKDFNTSTVRAPGTHFETFVIEEGGSIGVNHTKKRLVVIEPGPSGTLTGNTILGKLNLSRQNEEAEVSYSALGDSDDAFHMSFDAELDEGTGLVAYDRNTDTPLDSGYVGSDGLVTLTLPNQFLVRADIRKTQDSINFSDGNNTIGESFNGTIKFFEPYPDGDTILARNLTVENGTATLGEVPTTKPWAVVVNTAPGYYDRRVYLPSIEEQSRIYLLNKSEHPNAPLIRFRIDDRSGNFGSEAKLQILKAINTSDSPPGELEYQIVSGDILGISKEVSARLEAGARYRLRLVSPNGDKRLYGPFTPRDDRVVNLEVGNLDFDFEASGTNPIVNTTRTVTGEGGNKEVQLSVRYVDPTERTTDLRIVIHERRNESNVLQTLRSGSIGDPLGTFTYTTTLTGKNANTSWVAAYEIQRNGTVREGTTAFGPRQFNLDFPLDSGWKSILSVGFLLVLGGVFSLSNARIGAVIIPAVALLFWQLGWLDGQVELLSIAIAAAVAVAYNMVQTSGAILTG